VRAAIAIIVAVVAGMLLLALLLPSTRDASVAGWWRRVRTQTNLAVRVVLVLAVAAGVTFYVLLPILGWIRMEAP
jgi:hypothetical protein